MSRPVAFLDRLFRTLGTLILLAALAVMAEAAPAGGDDERFSATLLASQRGELGFDQLTAENIASIDAQVRQDIAAARKPKTTVHSTAFSQRRTDTERAAAGLDRLSAAQRERLDGFVALRIAGVVPPVSINSAGGAASGAPLAVQFIKPKPEIHGSATVMYGWSDAGSFKGGELVMTYDDPANRYSILFAYSVYDGPAFSRYGYGYDDDYRYGSGYGASWLADDRIETFSPSAVMLGETRARASDAFLASPTRRQTFDVTRGAGRGRDRF